MTQPLAGMSLVQERHAAVVAETLEKLARREALYPEMSAAPVHRVNLAMMLISATCWYGHELTPRPTNGEKQALEQEFADAVKALNEWNLKGNNIEHHAISNRALAVKEGRLK